MASEALDASNIILEVELLILTVRHVIACADREQNAVRLCRFLEDQRDGDGAPLSRQICSFNGFS